MSKRKSKKTFSTCYCSAAVPSWNRIITAFARLLETIVIELLSRGDAENIMSECFDQWLTRDKLKNDIVKQIQSRSLFIQRVAGFIK